ncbi:MAG: hypothetical protein B7Z36_02160 [Novosphingobium sp. 12-63-9]|nr:MAG: hypothetical protein B7Z36_02160 [Novosphingobium sp. 12-63-9]
MCIYASELSDEFAWEEVYSKVKSALLKHSKEVERRVVFDGHRPKDVVGDMIVNTCLHDIEMGIDHTYRGILGMNGQSKRSIFAKIVTQQFAEGWINAAELGIANENMKSAIAGAG